MTSTPTTLQLDGTDGDLPDVPGVAKPAPAAYTPADLDACKAIAKWMAERGHSQAWMARRVRRSSGTINQILKGAYPSPPGALLQAMQQVVQVESERTEDGTPEYVKGSVHKLAFVVCDRTRKHANFGVLVGNVGVGKTRTLREYQARKPQTLLIEGRPLMGPGMLLSAILAQLKLLAPYGMEAKFDAVLRALADTNYLLIVDEAETISPQALHYLRRVRDLAKVGVVLAGTAKLVQMLKPEHGQFEQIRSRVSMWPETIGAITRDDADEIARAALADAPGGELSDDVLASLWAYGDGSARVLVESLIPAIRDYGYDKGALTAKLVDTIAAKVLFLKRGNSQRAAE